MIITTHTLEGLLTGFRTTFNNALAATPSHYQQIAMTIPSSTRENAYAWLGQVPRLAEWIGRKRIKGLTSHGFAIQNRNFEVTIGVKRTDIEDDQYGVYAPLFAEMGRNAATHPDELIFELLKAGFTTACYDGKNFFDTEHPSDPGDGASASVSNMQDGAGEPWFLFDTSRSVKPMIFQKRQDYIMAGVTDRSDSHVFQTGEYLYGSEGRVNAGFGLWELAFGSKADLTSDNYRDARAAMMGLSREGRPLGIVPDTLVCGPALEEKALQLINSERTSDDVSNVWKGTAKLIITPWLA